MISIFDRIRDVDFLSLVIKLLLACFCGAIVGLERSSKNRPAGFRTHILVCLGACIAAVTSLYLYLGAGLTADISRISSQVISGLGFIGAGTIIITKKMTIKGLTTAAGLWTTGIIGLAIGSGFYEGGIIVTILVLLTETVFAAIGEGIQKRPMYAVELLYTDKDSLDEVLRFFKDKRMAIVNLHIQSLEEHENASYSAEVTLRGGIKAQDLLIQVQQMSGIVSASEIWE